MLAVQDLRVQFDTRDGVVHAVRGLDLTVARGQTLGIVGESGSGKSVAMLAVLGLSGGTVRGRATFDGLDLLTAPEPELREIRGDRIAMIFQDPLSSLHPYYRVGWQIAEAIRAHEPVARAEARRQAVELLDRVGIPQASRRVDAYPHEFSGGMRQRVMIAMALALRPEILIADEPTTALDVTVQAQILELIRDLQSEHGMAVVLITHDLGVVAEVVDEVLVMYAGRAVEQAPVRTLYQDPHHPYTRGLLRSVPAAAAPDEPLESIVGQPPSPIDPPSGCPFHPRCPYVFDPCPEHEPPLAEASGPGHRSACWLPAGLTGVDPRVDRARQAHVYGRRTEERVRALLCAREQSPVVSS